MDVYQQSLELHRQHGGKLEVKSKVPLTNREDLSLAYTPGVAEVCREIGKNKLLAREYTLKRNTVAVVTDGSAILGLGNLGPEAAIPVMEGKAVLFKTFANVDAFPICLATQDVDEIVEAVKKIAPVFGGINLEDIAAPRCFEVEARLKKELGIPVMHDDQHGTAVVVLAGLLNALKVVSKELSSVKIVVAGAGAAGIATTKLLLKSGVKNIVVCDRQGAIHSAREALSAKKQELAQTTNPNQESGELRDVLAGADIFIGVSAPDMLNADMVKSMAPASIIFALANPVPEIMPDIARAAGAAVVATGRSDFPNQVNNVLAFPGIFRGALDNGVQQLTDDMFVAAAHALADLVPNPTVEKILPSIFEEGVSRVIASVIK